MPPTLLSLPVEMQMEIASSLSGRDVKNLRLVCRKASERFPLKFSRVFLSPNDADIEVFHLADAVEFQTRCELETAKTRVRQKRFSQLGLQLADKMKRPEADEDDYDFSTDFSEPRGGMLSASKCIQVYNSLVRCQKENIESREDLRALSDYIYRFPRLKKITICHATQGWLFEPFYDTPTIRLLPRGFRYQPNRLDWMRTYEDEAWTEMKSKYSKYFRGYIGILNIFASIGNNLQIEELSIQSNGLRFGLTAHIFDHPTPEYRDFVAMLSRPTFRRLDLTLTTNDQYRTHWPAFRSGHLRHALSQAVNLEHFSLTADIHTCFYSPDEDCWTPLKQFIPISYWPMLRSFRLMDFVVKQDDLVTFLGALPPNVRIIELGQIHFVPGHGDYATLLDLIKTELHWSDRQVAKQPRLTIIIAISDFAPPGMMIWIDFETQEFIYNDGENPFRGPRGPMNVDAGVGVERDAFNPGHEWPHQDDFDWEEEVRIMRRQNYRLRMDLNNYLDNIAWGPDVASRLLAAREGPRGPWLDDEIDDMHFDASFDIE
ncbi:unnamed protein product [Clonostachys rosea]|uniref:F-box domain-containing protein n=1 Tax=Bionectria ochroleuca TaxID=29856 RepID=A0ABY6U0U9_BIOOC|nr:unnamed protein product [Clonostachys rosea]